MGTIIYNISKVSSKPRVLSITSSSTPTVNTNNYDVVSITALATNIISFTANLTGTPSNFDKLLVSIKDNGVPRTINWGTAFGPKGVSLPTTTVSNKVLTVGFIYDVITSQWGCVSSVQEV